MARPKKENSKTEQIAKEKTTKKKIREENNANIVEANRQLEVIAQKFIENPQPFFDERIKEVAEELLLELGKANSCFCGDSIDFIKKQARGHIENMVVQAKANISAYIDQKIYSTGLQELEKLKLESKQKEQL